MGASSAQLAPLGGASPLGLSAEEAGRRLEALGRNEIEAHGSVSLLSSIGAQLRDPLILVLLAACVLTVVTGDWTDAAVIALVVVVNTAVGVRQEIKADRAVAALAALSAPSVRVRRGGVESSVPAAHLVPGDVVLLAEGDVVPADCRVLEASSVLVDESALTGESVAVGKSGPHGEEAGETLSSGTVVVKGRAVAEVEATGASSALGRIAALLDTRVQPTPLQRRLAGLGRVLAIVAVALSGVVLVLGLLRGEPLELMLVTAVSLAVAAVPESLPAVVTLSLGLGARRMAARNAIVRRLSAVETLGSVTVLATDKTGTLTQAQMVVEQLWTPQHQVVVSSGTTQSAYADGPVDGALVVGGLVVAGETVAAEHLPDVVDLLRAAVLCNDARLVAGGAPLGDPTECALLEAAATAGLDKADLDRRHPRLGEVPFDSARQSMTTVHEDASGGRVLVVSKGSVESLHAAHGHGAHARLWHEASARAAELSAQGYRVLAVTAGTTAEATRWEQAEQRLLGLVGMNDPAKPAARATLATCRQAGITPVLITGDHRETARALALDVGILEPGDDAVATGADIDSGTIADLTGPRVFARATPEHKLAIVQAWKDRGAVVAMTGDGVNDGPALRRADIGVAMGHRGTEVARQAADLVLADDELSTVVAAVSEGRRVYDNIRLFLVFGLSGGAAEILLMLVGPFVGLVVPLLAAQILWINLLTHGLTGVALGAEPASPGILRRTPRPPEQSVLGDRLWQRILVVSLVLSVATLWLGLWGADSGRAWQTMVFLGLTAVQLGVALGLRPRALTRANPLLPAAVLGAFALALAGVYLPVLQDLLGTVVLPASDALAASALVVVGWLAARLTRTRPPRSAA